ncbi:MAG: hypothetical protein ACFFG0_01780 [Candidatus Thorarchaeota archaeon]
MPRLMPTSDTQIIDIPGPGNFKFSAIRPENLGATEYTLVTMVIDVTGSVRDFADELLDCVKSIVGACKKNQRSENLMLRFITFNETLEEIHGFLPLADIDPNNYDEFFPDGMTALYDASYSGIGATLTYAKNLIDQDFDVNGCIYIVTDGADNKSKITPKHIADMMEEASRNEQIHSLITVLVGLNDPKSPWTKEVKMELDKFKNEGKLTQFVDAGDATPDKLARLGNFVSESISSQSQALANKTQSQPLTF